MNREKWKEFGILNLGTALVIVGVYFFKFPNHFSIGGVSGLSLILSALIPGATPATLMLIFNMVLLAVGFALLGKDFGIKTAYSSVLLSAATWVLERVCPMSAPLTDEPLLELMFAVMLPAVGSAMLFNIGASTGGTDVTAMLLRKYTDFDIGRSLMISDFLITAAALFVFGPKTGLFSILGLGLRALAVDSVIENFNLNKFFTIITSEPDKICSYIADTLHRGATTEEATGFFTHQHRTVVLTVLSRSQALFLRRYVKQVDPKAFIVVTNTSEIIGKGFRGTI